MSISVNSTLSKMVLLRQYRLIGFRRPTVFGRGMQETVETDCLRQLNPVKPHCPVGNSMRYLLLETLLMMTICEQKKCQKAEETSDLNSDMKMGRQIKTPARLRCSSESSSDKSEIDIHSSLLNNKSATTVPRCPLINLKQPVPVKVSEKVNPTTSTRELNNNLMTAIPRCPSISSSMPGKVNLVTPTREHQCNCCPEHSIKTNELLKQIIRKLSMVELTMADIRSEVNKNSTSIVEAEYRNIWIEFNLPLKTNEELDFEGFLKIEQTIAESVTELTKLGGDTANEFIKRALQKLITNRLAAEDSWVGLKKKKKISKLNIVNLLTVSAQKNIKTKLSTVFEIENAIKKYLRQAKERADAEDKKVNQ